MRLHQVAGLACGLARPRGGERLLDDATAHGRLLVEHRAQLGGYGRLDDPLHIGVAEPGLGLALELRLGELHRHDGGEALTHVVARKVGVGVLEQLGPARIVVERARERGAEAGEVAAAVDGVDAVRERVDRLVEALAVLQRHFDERVPALVVDVDRVGVERPAAAVEVAHVGVDARVEVEGALARQRIGAVGRGALVMERDPDAAGEVGHLAEARRERVELVVERLEDVLVGQGR